MPDDTARSHAHSHRILRAGATILATLLLVLVSAGPAAGSPSSPNPSGSGPGRFLRLDVDAISPSVVTSGGGAEVTVSGEVHNVGHRMLHALSLRVERGGAVADANGLRTTLTRGAGGSEVATGFRPIRDELPPGASARFSITTSLSGPDGLNIQQTGVYPLRINVNGTPDYGNPAKLAESRTLLPVLSLPPDSARAANYVGPSAGSSSQGAELGPDGSLSANLSSPARFTLLWPLAAAPQLSPGVLGGNTEPVRLVGDQLARSLSPGGRLATLLDAARSVAGAPGPSSPSAPPPAAAGPPSAPTPRGPAPSLAPPSPPAPTPSKLQQSMCVAIDPDLLVTVQSMALGYVVSDDPMNPTSRTTAGAGQQTAQQWLAALRDLAGRMCVVALPFAQADLTSLARIHHPGLTSAALSTPADVIDTILNVHSVRGMTIPALGALDSTGAGVLRSDSIPTATTSTSTVAAARPDPAGRYRVGDLGIQTVQAQVSAALGGLGDNPTTPLLTPTDQQVPLADDSPVARREAAVAALAYPAIAAPSGDQSPESLPTAGRSAFVMPPTMWAPTADDAHALLTTATLLLESGAAVATPLPQLVADVRAATDPARLVAPSGVPSLESLAMSVNPDVAARMRSQTSLSWQIQASLMRSEDVAPSPERYLATLREDLLRAIRTPTDTSDAARDDVRGQRSGRTAAVGSTLQRMRNAVTILDPGGRYTLASERSPLLLVVRNDLSLPIRVRINVNAPRDLNVGDIGVTSIPARGTRQIQLPTRATSSEATAVTISMQTSSGLNVGKPIRLSVHANAYGKTLFWVTVAAGIILVLLVIRRLWHRFRGEPDRADEGRPDPDEHARQLAGAPYLERRRTLHLNEDDELDRPDGDDDPITPPEH